MNSTMHRYLSVQVSATLFVKLLLLVMVVSESGPGLATGERKSPLEHRDFEQALSGMEKEEEKDRDSRRLQTTQMV